MKVVTELEEIVEMPGGPDRTAALAAWFQGLFEPDERPALVGGAAVELLTDGAYHTGDLDFIGQVPSEIAETLRRNGFRRAGRHWIREEGQVFLELPATALEEDQTTVELRRSDVLVLSIGPEELVVDRLAAWQFWKSAEDGANAYLVWRANALDRARLRELAGKRQVTTALESLVAFRNRWRTEDPSAEELARWAEAGP